MIPAVSFIGASGSGKTMLIAQLVPLLRARGHRVGTAKHVSQKGEVDLAEKDSSRHRAAGAERTLVVTDSSLVLFSGREPGESLEETIQRTFAGCDLVLLEGFKQGPFPKIEVYCPQGKDAPRPLAWDIDVIAAVAANRALFPQGTRLLSPAEPLRIVEFLEEWLLGTPRA
jgi:molybdopterin-guanine dinucleotide biosynthesis protein MobB